MRPTACGLRLVCAIGAIVGAALGACAVSFPSYPERGTGGNGAVAASSTAAGPGSGGASASSSTGGSGPSCASSSASTGTGGGATTGTGGAAACQEACATNNMAAYMKFQSLELTDCGCAAGAACNSQCSSSCPDGPPSSGCSSCLTTESEKGISSSCTETAGLACMNDSTCAPFVSCYLSCP